MSSIESPSTPSSIQTPPPRSSIEKRKSKSMGRKSMKKDVDLLPDFARPIPTKNSKSVSRRPKRPKIRTLIKNDPGSYQLVLVSLIVGLFYAINEIRSITAISLLSLILAIMTLKMFYAKHSWQKWDNKFIYFIPFIMLALSFSLDFPAAVTIVVLIFMCFSYFGKLSGFEKSGIMISRAMEAEDPFLDVDASILFMSVDGSHVSLMNNLVRRKVFKVVKENEYEISYNYVQEENAAIPQFVHIPIGELAGVSKSKVNIPNKGLYEFINLPVIWNSETYPAQLDNLKDALEGTFNPARVMTLNVHNVENFLSKASLLNVNNILDQLTERNEDEGYLLILTGFSGNSCTDPAIIKKIQSCPDLNVKPHTILCLSNELSNEMIQHVLNSMEKTL